MKQIELKEKRKPREKHFLQEDGTIVAKLYDENIHYLKNEKYKEIDNTIIKNSNYYINKDNLFKTLFFSSNNKLMRVEIEKKYIDFAVVNCNLVDPLIINGKNKLYSKVFYEDILDGINIEYNLNSNQVKEVIVLKNADSINNDILFEIKTNLELKIDNSNKIIAYDTNNALFTFELPFMVDKNDVLNSNVKYELKKQNDLYLLTLKVDKKWLLDTDRKYPVIIDPTITNFGNNNNVYDTYIFPGDTNINRGTQDILKVGVERVNNNDIVNRALLKFDLPAINTGDQIIDATLDLIGYMSNSSLQNQIINVHQVTSDWSEDSVDWNTINDKYNQSVENCFLGCRSILNGNTIVYSHARCKITNLVKKWYTDTPNYGIMLKLNEERYVSDVIPAFYSKNNSFLNNNPKPILTITYRNQNGLEEYMSYYSKQLCRGTIHLNLYNGNITCVFNMTSTIGGKLPIGLDLVYNSNDILANTNYGYGLGFKLDLHQIIKEEVIDGDNYISFIDKNGTVHYFKYNNGIFYDEDGLDLKARKDSQYYIISDKDNNQMKFIQNGSIYNFIEYKDTSNNIISIIYENEKIKKVIDASNNEINISYDNDRVIISSNLENVCLNYNDGLLSSIETRKGITYISYNNKGLIASIQDENGLRYSLDYYGQIPYRIKEFKEYSLNNNEGNSVNLVYGLNTTKLIDENGKVDVLTFNVLGNEISEINQDITNKISSYYGISKAYGNEQMLKNKMLNSQIPQKHVHNFLSNGSFAKNEVYFTSQTSNISITDDCSFSGNQCLKITNNSNGESIYVEHVLNDRYYTFSCYLKNTCDIKLVLSYINGEGEEIISESSIIKPKSSFEREEITIYYSSCHEDHLGLNIKIVSLTSGIIYVDNAQLEEGEVANEFNYVENSNFYLGLVDWTAAIVYSYDNNIINNEDILDNIFEIENVDDELKALCINMNPQYVTEISQNYNIPGKKGEIYSISFWYKNMGVKEFDSSKNCTAYLKFIYGDNYALGHEIFCNQLNSDCTEWQFFSQSFVAEDDFDGIQLLFNQSMNANKLYITNIAVYKDLRSIVFTYDENGNIKYVKGLNNEKDGFNYNNDNQLLSVSNPIGKEFSFEYDNSIKDRVISGITELGISNKVIYDNEDNPIITKIINVGLSNINNNDLLCVRLKGTNMYFANINNNLKLLKDNCCHNIWKFEKDGDYFRIRHSIITDRVIAVNNNNVVLINDNTDNSLFKLEKNENGSYLIKMKQGENYLKFSDKFEICELNTNDIDKYQFYCENPNYKDFMEQSASYDNGIISKVEDLRLNNVLYDIDSNSGLTNSITKPNNMIVNYTYNNNFLLSSVNYGNRTILYNYNSNGLLDNVVQGNRKYKLQYNEFLNISKIFIGESHELISNCYEPKNGKLIQSIYGNGDTISFNYDNLGRLKKCIKMDSEYLYKYTNNGYLSKIISNKGIEDILFDNSKRIHCYRYNDFAINYTYDKKDNIIAKKEVLCNCENITYYSYYVDDSLSVMQLDNNSIYYNYDKLGRLIDININNGFHTYYSYCSAGRRTSKLVKSISIDNEIYEYKYDKMDNIVMIYHNGCPMVKYIYDEYNQLIKEVNYSNSFRIQYKYDNLGNIISKKKYPIYDNNILSCHKYKYDNVWPDQLKEIDNTNIIYDFIGNPITIGNINLTWINGRELKTFDDGQSHIEYVYNQDGVRIKKIIDGSIIEYYVNGNDIIYEKRGNNSIYYIRDAHGNLEGIKYNNDTYYYVKNVENDIIGILDNNLHLIVRYEYDSWGNIISIKDFDNNDISLSQDHIANINPYRYRGYYYDVETGLYYLNSRYYNSKWGRYINADSYLNTGEGINGTNMYLYCNNNPIQQRDSDGRFSILAVLKVAAAVVSLVVAVNTVIQKKKSSSKLKKEKSKIKPKSYCPVTVPKSTKFAKVLKKNAKIVKKDTKKMNPITKIQYTFNNYGKNKKFDFKNQPEWQKGGDIYYDNEIMTIEDAGNYHFGYTGRAMGFSTEFLIKGAGAYQVITNTHKIQWCFTESLCDDPRDTYYIRKGAEAYERDTFGAPLLKN